MRGGRGKDQGVRPFGQLLGQLRAQALVAPDRDVVRFVYDDDVPVAFFEVNAEVPFLLQGVDGDDRLS